MTTTFNHGFTEEQVALKESALAFTKREVTPYLDQWERDGQVPRELQKTLAHAGFLGIGVPEDVGGDGGNLLDACAMQQGFMEGGWSGGLMASAFTHGIAIPHIIQNGSTEVLTDLAARLLGYAG
jgi:acyl-CoA dehydrogenase